MKDSERFKKNMAGLAELFDKKLTEALLSMYWQIFEDWDDGRFEHACHWAARSCKFFPKPVELLKHNEGGEEIEAYRAWKQLVDNLNPYETVIFEDGRIGKVVQLMGGWREINSWRQNTLPFRRQEFIKLYQALPPNTAPVKLIGTAEGDCRDYGYDEFVPEPIVVPKKGEKRCLLN